MENYCTNINLNINLRPLFYDPNNIPTGKNREITFDSRQCENDPLLLIEGSIDPVVFDGSSFFQAPMEQSSAGRKEVRRYLFVYILVIVL